MPSNVRIEWHDAEPDLLRLDSIRADMERRAQRVAAVAGPGNVAHSEIQRHRARASVVTETFEAKHAEAVNHALTRAIDAGR